MWTWGNSEYGQGMTGAKIDRVWGNKKKYDVKKRFVESLLSLFSFLLFTLEMMGKC